MPAQGGAASQVSSGFGWDTHPAWSPDGQFLAYSRADGLSGDIVDAIYQDHEGSLWVGTLDGLSRLRDGTFTNYHTGDGLANLWAQVLAQRDKLTRAGEFAARRKEQQVKWLWTMLDERLIARLKSDPALKSRLPALEAAVAEGRLSPALAVEEIAGAMGL